MRLVRYFFQLVLELGEILRLDAVGARLLTIGLLAKLLHLLLDLGRIRGFGEIRLVGRSRLGRNRVIEDGDEGQHSRTDWKQSRGPRKPDGEPGAHIEFLDMMRDIRQECLPGSTRRLLW